MLVKLTEELTNAKDKLIEVVTGKKVIKPKVLSEVNTGCATEKTEAIQIMPKRDCRHKANRTWVNGIHGISDDRLRDAIEIVMNEGQYCPDILLEDSANSRRGYEMFTARRVKVRGDCNPTIRTAMNSDKREGWKKVILEEWNMMCGKREGRQRSISERIYPADQKLGPGARVIRSSWQLLEKLDKEGNHERFKARCCASGDMLKDVIMDTFSPTVNSLTAVLLQNIAMIDELVEASADVVGAFLYPDYPQDEPALYMKLDDHVADIVGEPRGCWYRFLKYVYGLPAAGKAFYEIYRDLLLSYGYVVSKHDPCLFFKHVGNDVIYLWIHVDDTYVCASNQLLIDELFEQIRTSFEITTKDIVDSYIGIKHERLANGDLKLTQPKLLNKLFKTWEITEENKDIYPSKQYVSPKLIAERKLVDRIMYLTLLGGLIYILKTRPDIGFAVSLAATKSTNPDTVDWMELRTILHYLFNTRNYGLVLEKLPKGSELELVMCVDAGYLTHPDSRSHTCFNLRFGKQGSFYTKSVKQSTIATSSTHAESIGMSSGLKECIFVEGICEEIGRPIKKPILVLEDNAALITLMTQDTGISKRTKHFLMLLNWCREQVKSGLISIEYVLSEENIADIGTKALFGQDFRFKRQGLIGVQEGEAIEESVKRVKKIVTFDDATD